MWPRVARVIWKGTVSRMTFRPAERTRERGRRRALRRMRGIRLATGLLALGLSLAACAKNDSGSNSGTGGSSGAGGAPASNLKVGLAYDIGGRGDQSFNDS